jgi:hypothetical protein
MAWEVESLVEAGPEPYEALTAATRRGGALLGEEDAGVIRDEGRPTSSSSTAIPSQIPPRSGASGVPHGEIQRPVDAASRPLAISLVS